MAHDSRIKAVAGLAVAAPGAFVILVAAVNNLYELADASRPDWIVLAVFLPVWISGIVAYGACVAAVRRDTAMPWIVAAFLFALGTWPLMLSGIGVVAALGAAGLAVGARTRSGFAKASPAARAVASAAGVVLVWFAWRMLRGGMPSPADWVLVAALAGLVAALAWPVDSARATPAPPTP